MGGGLQLQYGSPCSEKHVSRFGLAVRRKAGKRKDLGSNRFGSHFASERLWFVDTVL